MSSRDDEIMRSLGRIEGKLDGQHEHLRTLGEKVARHVEDRALHYPPSVPPETPDKGGIRIEVPHLIGGSVATGVVAFLVSIGHKLRDWFAHLVEAARHAPPPPPHT